MRIKYVLIYIFLIIIFSFPILHILISDKDFSFIENRYLEKIPKFSYEKLISGEFNKQLSSYIDDHFPLRDGFITLRSYFEILIGRRDINGVYICKNNYLMEMFKDIDISITENNLSLINNLSENFNICVMLIPTSSEILYKYLPPFASNIDQSKYLKYVKQNLNSKIKFINPIKFLKSKQNQYIYYLTDHHYTTLGAYYCYLKFCSDNNITPELNFNKKMVSNNFLGSLFSKVNLPTQKKDSIYIFEDKSKNDVVVDYITKKSNTLYEFSYLKDPRNQYNIFLDNNHPLIKINTSINNGKKLCIIKDSYANSIIPFIVNHFEEIHIIDLRFYGTNIIKYLVENDIEDILIYYNIKNFCEDRNLIFLENK